MSSAQSSGDPLASLDDYRKAHDSPAAARNVLGMHLRKLRLKQNLTLAEVAPEIRGSVSKISRLERGQSPPKTADVHALLRFFGVHDAEKRERFDHLLKAAQKNEAWWKKYKDVMPDWLEWLISVEDTASELRTYETTTFPGLLQIEEYAHAVAATAQALDDAALDVKRIAQLRVERQRILAGPEAPLFVALIDEGAVFRPWGGHEVMCRQLEHLRELSSQRNVQIRIISLEASATVPPTCPLTHLKFDTGTPEMIYMEQPNSAQYLSKQDEVEHYKKVFLGLQNAAETRKSSLKILDNALMYHRSRSTG